MISEWRAAIAGADMADWVTVAAYLAAAWLSVMAARAQRTAREGMFWRLTSVLLVVLGMNELLDLQTLLTAVVRDHAKANGWYGQHRQLQYAFVLALGVAATILGLAITWFTRRMHPAVRAGLLGLIFIAAFVLLRAASFHHFDDVLGRGWPVFNLGSLQELFGILVVALAAFFYRWSAASERAVAK